MMVFTSFAQPPRSLRSLARERVVARDHTQEMKEEADADESKLKRVGAHTGLEAVAPGDDEAREHRRRKSRPNDLRHRQHRDHAPGTRPRQHHHRSANVMPEPRGPALHHSHHARSGWSSASNVAHLAFHSWPGLKSAPQSMARSDVRLEDRAMVGGHRFGPCGPRREEQRPHLTPHEEAAPLRGARFQHGFPAS